MTEVDCLHKPKSVPALIVDPRERKICLARTRELSNALYSPCYCCYLTYDELLIILVKRFVHRCGVRVTWGKTAPGGNTAPRLICQTNIE